MLSSSSWSAGVSDEPTSASSSGLRFWAAHWSIAVVASPSMSARRASARSPWEALTSVTFSRSQYWS